MEEFQLTQPLHQIHNDIFNVLEENIQRQNYSRSPRVVRMSINALANTCYRSGNSIATLQYQSLVQLICDPLIFFVQRIKSDNASLEGFRIVSSSLRALNILLNEDKAILFMSDTSSSIPITKQLSQKSSTLRIDCDLLTILVDALVQCIFSKNNNLWLSMSTFRVPLALRQLHLPQNTQPLKSDSPLPFSSSFTDPLLLIDSTSIPDESQLGLISDSDTYSDSDIHSSTNTNRISPLTKIRLNALITLTSIVKITGNSFYSYWNRFISIDSSTTTITNFTRNQPIGDLLSLMKDDLSPRVRILASSTLSAFFMGAKPYLSLANDTPSMGHTSSFTSLSTHLGILIKRIHEKLIDTIRVELVGAGLVQHIKTLVILSENVCYSKLHISYLPRIINCLIQLLTHIDVGVQITTLSALSSIASVLIKENGQYHPDSNECAHNSDISECILTLMQVCIARLQLNDISTQEDTVHCWEIITCLLHPSLTPNATFQPYSTAITSLINSVLQNDTYPRLVSLVTAKALEQLCRRLFTKSMTIEDTDEPTISLETSLKLDNGDHSLDGQLQQWLTLADANLQYLLQVNTDDNNDVSDMDAYGAFNAIACDILSTINDYIFVHLHQRQQLFYMTSLLSLASSKNINTDVRASASRALGAFVVLPSLHDDAQFLHDGATILCHLSMNDDQLAVRIRASWALANLTNVLISHRHINTGLNTDDIYTRFDSRILATMLAAGVHAAKDNERCRANGVRCFGAVLRLYGDNGLDLPNELELQSIVAILIKCITTGPLKNRWNACHAAGTWFQSDATLPSTIVKPLIDTLKSTVANVKNFKVRINAATALAAISSLSTFDSQEEYTGVLDTLSACRMAVNDEIPRPVETKYVTLFIRALDDALKRLTEVGRGNGISIDKYIV